MTSKKNPHTPPPGLVTVVVPGKSIMASDGVVLRPKTILKPGLHGLTEEDIETAILEGRAMQIAPGQEIDEVEFRTRPQAPAMPAEIDDSSGEGVTKEGSRLLPPPTPRTGAPTGKSPGKWSYDPESLKGKTLPQLNSLVMGIDSSTAAFSTIEEAIAQLSADFRRNQAGKEGEQQSRVS